MRADEESSFRRHLVIYLANFLSPVSALRRAIEISIAYPRYQNGAPVIAKKKKSGKSELDRRLSFQISCPLYSSIRIYLTPYQKMLLNLFYQSWQRQTMLCNNSCQSLGYKYVDLHSCYCSRTVLVCRHSVLKSSVALTCWSSSNLNIY